MLALMVFQAISCSRLCAVAAVEVGPPPPGSSSSSTGIPFIDPTPSRGSCTVHQQVSLIRLPSYCPELNPNELLNHDVNTHGLGTSRPAKCTELVKTMRAICLAAETTVSDQEPVSRETNSICRVNTYATI